MRYALSCALVLAGLFILGCEQADDTTTVPPPTPSDTATPAPTTAPGMSDMQGSMEDAKQRATQAVEGAKAEAGEAATALGGNAQKLLDQAMQYIKENKLDLAEQSINQLEKMGDTLPASVKEGLNKAKAALAAAKSGSGQ